MKQKLQGKLTYANVVSTLCLFVLLGGSAWAAGNLHIPPNSVGSRQIKSKAVTSGKLANGAVTAAKVAEGSLTGANLNLNALGTVPQSANAEKAAEAAKVDGHVASCPQGTTEIRGICFDATANPPAESPQEAADACAAKGGWLPSPLQLYSVRNVLNLGTGTGSDSRFTDEIYANTTGGNYRSVVVNGNGAISEISSEGHVPERYICVYPLVH